MENAETPHRLVLDSRKKLSVTGVTQVVSFDENAVILKTDLGTLEIQGSGLQLITLDGGQVAVDGQVSSMTYEEPRRALKSRLFG